LVKENENAKKERGKLTDRVGQWWGVHRTSDQWICGRKCGHSEDWSENRVRKRVHPCRSWNRRRRTAPEAYRS